MTNDKLNSLVLAALVVMSVFASTVAFTGAAAAANTASDHDYDTELTPPTTEGNAQTVWAGQNLLYNGNANETLTLFKSTGDGDEFVREVQTGSGGHYVVDTGDYSGTYYFENSSGDKTYFEVRQQSITAALGSDTVTNGNTGNTVEFDYDSNRASSNVTVSADGDLTAETLKDIFADNYNGDKITMNTSEETVTLVGVENHNDNAFNLNFTGVDNGEYTLNFDVTDSAASDSATVTVGEASEADAQIEKSVYSEERGDVVAFTINLENTDTADVRVGGEDVGYTANLSVTDNNDDGQVTVFFNTFEAGDGDGVFTDAYYTDADNKDTVTVSDETDIAVDVLAKAAYDISSFAGDSETDVATINLNERSTEGVSVHTAPKGAGLSDAQELANNSVVDNSIAMEDQFVVEVSASGLGGLIGDSATAADFQKGSAFAQEHGAYVVLEEADPGMNSDAKKLDVSKASFVADSENDSYYFVFDSSDVAVEAEDEYTATFTLNESNAYIEDEDSVEESSDSVNFVERKVTFDAMTEDADDNKLLVYDLSEDKTVTISGDSTVAPGTEFSLRVRSDGASPFLKSQQVTVQDDGSFTTTFDMSDVEKSTEFTTQARGLSDEIDSELNVEKATVSASDSTAQGSAEAVTVDNVKLPQGGFVVVHAEDGSVLGVSDYLEAGQHSDVEVTLEEPLQIGEHSIEVMAHQDDGNSAFDSADADEPYTADGSPVTATATVTVEEPTYTVTVNVENADAAEVTLNGETKTAEGGAVTFEVQDGSYTAQVSADGYQDASADVTVDGADASATVTLEQADTGTETPTDTPDDNNTTDQPDDSDNTSDEKTPGFGIAVALVALAGAALLARRQD